MSDDNMNGDTPEIPAQLPPDRGLSPLPGPQDLRAPGGSGPQEGRGPGGNGSLDARRAADYGFDPYGGGYGFSLAKNRFQETSALMARLHRYELSLRKHWWILALALCVSIGPAAYHVRTTPKSYSSTGKLWMSGKLDIKEGQLYLEELTSFMGTQVELLKSAVIYSRALTNAVAANPAWSSLYTNISPDEPGPFKVTVTDFPKSAVIEVKAVGEEPAAVRMFVNSLMEEYQVYRKGVRQQKSDVTLTSITEQVKQLELDVRHQQERLQNFLGSNNVVLLQEQGSSAGAFAARLSKQLASLRTELKLLALITPEQLTQVGGKSRTSPDDESVFGQGTASDLMTTLAGPQADFFHASQQIQLLEAKREELLEFLLPSHPKILKLDDNIAEQQKILEVFKRQSLAQMGNRREALGLQITNLQDSAGEWETKALDASRRMADYERIRQDVARTQALYEKLLGVIQQVDVNRTLDQENVRVMDSASKPKPVRRTMIFLGLGTAAGLFLGFGMLFVVSLFDDRFASLGELSSQIPEVVIGQIPNIHTSRRHPRLELVKPNDERHAFGESFRNMRSWLLFSGDKAKQPRLILVTSAVPTEGKSTVSSNLALTLALSGSRVLLIDADLRRAGLDQIFDVPNDRGFADVLEQRASAHDVIHPTKTPNLWFLPAGSATMNPGELFLAPSCDIFLAKIRSQYDYILFDSAPVLATDDTANLAPKISAVLFVVRADYTSARNAREALQQLRQRQATILGLVFNRSIATRTGGYYYRYNKYYYYGANGKKRSRSKTDSAAKVTVAAASDTDKRA
jgi:capsular exopolysaccharide synthesis family protein